MKFTKLILTGALLAPLFMSAQVAEAAPYCREYQKRITVGGRVESGYGQACLQPDGDWLITETRGTVDPFDEFYDRNPNVILVSHQPVYFKHGRRNYYTPAYHHYRPNYYPHAYPARNSGVSFYFNFDDDDRRRRGSVYDQWNRNDRRDRHHRHDRHDRDDRSGRDRDRR